MDIKFTFLLTDIFLYVLLASFVFYGFYCLKFEHLRSPWRRVFSNKIALLASFVLILYILTGFLDSIHFQNRARDTTGKGQTDNLGNSVYDSELLSALDYILGDIKFNEEKTYSAPFALFSYSKKTVQTKDNKSIRIYPRLKFGGSHVKDPEKKNADLILKILKISLLFIIISIAVCYLSTLYKKNGKENILKNAPLILFFILIIFFAILSIYLSNYYHILGTDKVGKDVFYRALKGIRTGIVMGTLTTLIMLPFAILMGVSAGYFKGWIDDIIQYIYTTLSSIPGVLLIASAVLMLQVYMDTHSESFQDITKRADTRLFFLCMILGISSWTGLCRILRGETLKLREMEYVQASLALGTKPFKVILKHIVPNIMHIVLITVVLDFSGLVLAEAVLSYIGVGVDPTMESWGNMINAARLELSREPIVWWNLIASFILMFGLVLSANLFSDGVRDAFDPRLRTK